jgi:hypothetical protein
MDIEEELDLEDGSAVGVIARESQHASSRVFMLSGTMPTVNGNVVFLDGALPVVSEIENANESAK